MNEFKVLFLGPSATGAKSCLIIRIVENKFFRNYLSTIGVDFKTKTIQTNFGEIKLTLLDTPGHEIFRQISLSFIKGSHCIVLGYDITDRRSFESIKNYYKEIKNRAGDYPIIYLVGNKIDLVERRVISEEEGVSLAKELNIKYFGVSAKTGEGVNIFVEDMVNSIIKKFMPEKIDNNKLNKEKSNINTKSINKNKDDKLKTKEIKVNENKIDNNKKFKVQPLNHEWNNIALNKYINF